ERERRAACEEGQARHPGVAPDHRIESGQRRAHAAGPRGGIAGPTLLWTMKLDTVPPVREGNEPAKASSAPLPYLFRKGAAFVPPMGAKESIRKARRDHPTEMPGTLEFARKRSMPTPEGHSFSRTPAEPDLRADPYLRANTGLAGRAARALWGLVWLLLFRPSPRPLHAWRAGLLRLFGARLGAHCHIYPGARVWAPWNLECEDTVAVADGAEIYNPSRVRLGSHCVV